MVARCPFRTRRRATSRFRKAADPKPARACSAIPGDPNRNFVGAHLAGNLPLLLLPSVSQSARALEEDMAETRFFSRSR